ncbi:hypothetical protein PHISP_06205 [Aspergillus sp. HF37]|nr:hypothetical protein PHISP_06205 [Aspergillus sp. HF37]
MTQPHLYPSQRRSPSSPNLHRSSTTRTTRPVLHRRGTPISISKLGPGPQKRPPKVDAQPFEMAAGFPNFCAMCEKQILLPSNGLVQAALCFLLGFISVSPRNAPGHPVNIAPNHSRANVSDKATEPAYSAAERPQAIPGPRLVRPTAHPGFRRRALPAAAPRRGLHIPRPRPPQLNQPVHDVRGRPAPAAGALAVDRGVLVQQRCVGVGQYGLGLAARPGYAAASPAAQSTLLEQPGDKSLDLVVPHVEPAGEGLACDDDADSGSIFPASSAVWEDYR